MWDWIYEHLFPFGSPYAEVHSPFKKFAMFLKKLFGRKKKDEK